MEAKTYYIVSSKFGTRLTCDMDKVIDLVSLLKQIDVKFSVKSGPTKNGPFTTLREVYDV